MYLGWWQKRQLEIAQEHSKQVHECWDKDHLEDEDGESIDEIEELIVRLQE